MIVLTLFEVVALCALAVTIILCAGKGLLYLSTKLGQAAAGRVWQGVGGYNCLDCKHHLETLNGEHCGACSIGASKYEAGDA